VRERGDMRHEMADIAHDGYPIERAADVDVQDSVLRITPDLCCFNVLAIAEVVEIREGSQFCHLVEKSLAPVVDRGQNPRLGHRAVSPHLVEVQVKSLSELKIGGIPHQVGSRIGLGGHICGEHLDFQANQ